MNRCLACKRGLAGRQMLIAVLAVMVIAFASAPAAHAAGGILDLGKPTNSVSPAEHFPLSGFHKSGIVLRSGSRAKVLFLGTQLPWDEGSARERWPVIKALEQFGSFTGVNAVPHPCFYNTYAKKDDCFLPTFDWSHSTYRSSYVVFEHKDLATATDRKQRYYQRMTPIERELFVKYARSPIRLGNQDPDRIYASALNFAPGYSTHVLPLIAVGAYVQTLSQVILRGDFQNESLIHPGDPNAGTVTQYLTFDQLRQALKAATNPDNTSNLVVDVNAEANIISALICHVDGLKPAKVCGRAAIRHIHTHVK
jgi:hypothetical protein